MIPVVAVFAYLCADTFVKEPKIVVPSLGLIPAAMLITTGAALGLQAVKYWKNKDILLFAISVLLILLAVFMVLEVLPKILRRKKYA